MFATENGNIETKIKKANFWDIIVRENKEKIEKQESKIKKIYLRLYKCKGVEKEKILELKGEEKKIRLHELRDEFEELTKFYDKALPLFYSEVQSPIYICPKCFKLIKKDRCVICREKYEINKVILRKVYNKY